MNTELCDCVHISSLSLSFICKMIVIIVLRIPISEGVGKTK